VGKDRGPKVGAGDSARLEAELSAERARLLADAMAAEERRARNFAKGGAAEEAVGRALGELSAHDIHALHDRRWPGTRDANIDHLVVGTSGVYVIDTKDWAEPVVISNSGLFRGQASCDEELEKVRRMADAVLEELAEEGLAATQVRPVLAFYGQTIGPHMVNGVWVVGAEQLPLAIIRQGRLFTQAQVEQLLTRLLKACPPAAPALPAQEIPTPQSDSAGSIGSEVHGADALISREEIEDAALEAALQAPLADWMTFLHPTQARLVHRKVNGPSRISGAAGTGKTVVALHRAAYFAERRRGKLLYVTFVSSVPRVLRSAYVRMSPHTADRVEFLTLHSWATRFLHRCGIEPKVDYNSEAFDAAWRRVDPGLASIGNKFYWKDEVQRVIRGRGIDTLEQYLVLDRVGRGTRLGSQQRRLVWALVEEYQSELEARGLVDWEGLLRMARDECHRRTPTPYEIVIVDEVQDTTLVAMQLVRVLVGDHPENLLIVGDDQQRVFPGGFRLVEAGIDVTGRSTRLSSNYRNTREILEAARGLVFGDDDDLLEGIRQPDDVEVVRSGPVPVFTRADRATHDATFVAHLREALGFRLVPTDGLAVIVERRTDAEAVRKLLDRHDIPHIDLTNWDGSATSSVIVGLNKSAKGLEFKHVLIPYVAPELTEPDPPSDEYEAERWQMRRRELYVAMTRARDTLWVGCVDPATSGRGAS
jgi:hypothetical protein